MSEFTLTYEQVRYASRQNDHHPRVHGNGFIQLDLSTTERLNLWPEQRLPGQRVNTQIHSHRFDFHSRVLVGNGKLIHKTYAPWFTDTGDMDLYEPVGCEKEDTRLMIKGDTRCFMVIQSETRVWNEYTFRMEEFHETIAEGMVMTLMRKTAVSPTVTPLVAARMELPPDNTFSRYQISEDECWQHFKWAFQRLNRHWINPYAVRR